MDKQEFLSRFNVRSDKPLSRGFCEINGKKYYCLTDNRRTYQTVPMDSFTYFIAMRTFYDMAKSVGLESVYPELVNVVYKNGYLSGDIITEDFSRGEEKLETICISDGENTSKRDGYLIRYDNITLPEEAEQFKQLSKFYNNPQIYQNFIKQLLFHLYVGDEDFHTKNIEFFKKDGRVYRVSPMYDYGYVYYLNEACGASSDYEGFYYHMMHFMPEFAIEEYVADNRKNYGSEYTVEDFKNFFYIDKEVVSGREVLAGYFENFEEQEDLLYTLMQDLEDKDFVEKLLKIDIDKCLKDDLYNDNLKQYIKIGTIPTKAIIKRVYDRYKNAVLKEENGLQ